MQRREEAEGGTSADEADPSVADVLRSEQTIAEKMANALSATPAPGLVLPDSVSAEAEPSTDEKKGM